MIAKSKIVPCLLFQGNAEEAAKFYVKIFKKSKITHRNPMVTSFQLEGQDFTALNGPKAEFTWAVSFYVICKTQKEIDYYWNKLKAGGGQEMPCGWVKDKFGLSWQIAPSIVPAIFEGKGKDKVKSDRALAAMMKMKKLDIAKLKAAYNGK